VHTIVSEVTGVSVARAEVEYAVAVLFIVGPLADVLGAVAVVECAFELQEK
jgi:hypothetical protein